MIIHDVRQGEEVWHRLRLGIPTASKFDQILTPKTLKPAASAEKYMYQLLAEWIIGQPCDLQSNRFMERGTELEPEARKLYAFQQGVKVQEVGFITTDDGLIGCSPDGLIGDDGGLEIKCPMAPTHVKYLLNPKQLYEDYKLQVQGALYVTERDWWDIKSYVPGMPSVIHEVKRDPAIIEPLSENLHIFTQQLEIYKQRLIEKDMEPYEMIVQREDEAIDAELNEIFPTKGD